MLKMTKRLGESDSQQDRVPWRDEYSATNDHEDVRNA